MNKHLWLKKYLNKKGQVAIFVALIFQVLFLFFAMIINVGLLVHHKINLQNSVDLAAYYGAMKQAEGLNTVAHVNYQIRQSWKLLSWRYRVIGSAGERETNGAAQPYNVLKTSMADNLPLDADSDKINNTQLDFYEAPAFCTTYVPFRPMPDNENTCKNMATQSGVKLFRPPAVIAGFLGFTHSIQSASQYMLDQARKRCRDMGAINYIMLAKYVVAYNVDQADRMAVINKVSRAMSEGSGDFTDIDGESVKEGVKKTLTKNLTIANKEGDLTVDFYNSLGSDACGASGVSTSRPAKWLNTINIVPGFNYIDTMCQSDLDIIGKELVGTSQIQKNCPNYRDGYCGPHHYITDSVRKSDIDALSQYIGPRSDPDNIYNFTLGVEKNPWCMAYVGVRATAKPHIPFSPFGTVTLQARSYAKPFGGRVGPWYYNKWPRGYESVGSSKTEQTDRLLPKRVRDPSQLGEPKERIVNYSRFIGDTFGLMSRMVLGYGARAIYGLDPTWRTATSAELTAAIQGTDGSPSFTHWDHLPFDFSGSSKSGDILSWAGSVDKTPMRDLELAAVLPDPFDLAYYSIEPDFYHNYYVRLRDGLLAKSGSLSSPQVLRPDIGARIGDKDLESFSVKDQVRRVKSKKDVYPLDKYNISEKQTYLSLNWQSTLNSWSETSLIDYSLDTNKFGKCIFPSDIDSQPFLDPPSSGNCAAGGTTGYAVKIISSDYLNKQDLQLGGESAGTGPLYNPPPSDW